MPVFCNLYNNIINNFLCSIIIFHEPMVGVADTRSFFTVKKMGRWLIA
ncbi:hypothetical protein BMETH_1876_0 [methanotrophic bacterial endosymbiont of Bathymodiolus sp.]|nr:hypothetical protein BMETH_1876_0 [methanotrophic bacterial endosymbiont of Bathymodiolus sp.]